MKRLCNFSAGPAALPISVLEQAQSEFLEWRGVGASVMEISHRGKAFTQLAEEIDSDLRRIANIPESHEVLFMQGGATAQFALIPMNLLPKGRQAGFILTGNWGQKAFKESRRLGETVLIASSEDSSFDRIPSIQTIDDPSQLEYVHLTSNETITGVQWHDFPDLGVPLIADMSSDILSKPIDFSNFGLLYAGAQKNLGPSGLTLVIIRKDWLQRSDLSRVPSVFNYRLQAEQKSMLNTPNTYAWYLSGLMFKWIEEQGGLTAIQAKNQTKAKCLYDRIDQSDFYHNWVVDKDRSVMNVPFRLPSVQLDSEFVLQAEQNGMLALKGHKLSGGIRASIYNAMELDCVNQLVDFMTEFERTHG